MKFCATPFSDRHDCRRVAMVWPRRGSAPRRHWGCSLLAAIVIALTITSAPAAKSASEPAGPSMNSAAFLDVSPVFGANDQRERISERFADASTQRFLQHAQRGELEAMTALVRRGYDVNTPGREGLTPVMAYVSYVRPVRRDVLAQMIKLGADVTRPLSNNMALLNGLARVRDAGVLATLLQVGVSPNTPLPAIGETWLTVAIRENHTELALGLLVAGADPQLRGGGAAAGAGTPLQAALALANWVVVDALIRAGADPRLDDPELTRLSRALARPPADASSAQGKAHAAVAAWRAQRPPR
jgi:uncharacterized protein